MEFIKLIYKLNPNLANDKIQTKELRFIEHNGIKIVLDD